MLHIIFIVILYNIHNWMDSLNTCICRSLQNPIRFFEVFGMGRTAWTHAHACVPYRIAWDSLRYHSTLGMGRTAWTHVHACVPYRIPWGSLRYHSTLGMGRTALTHMYTCICRSLQNPIRFFEVHLVWDR